MVGIVWVVVYRSCSDDVSILFLRQLMRQTTRSQIFRHNSIQIFRHNASSDFHDSCCVLYQSRMFTFNIIVCAAIILAHPIRELTAFQQHTRAPVSLNRRVSPQGRTPSQFLLRQSSDEESQGEITSSGEVDEATVVGESQSASLPLASTSADAFSGITSFSSSPDRPTSQQAPPRLDPLIQSLTRVDSGAASGESVTRQVPLLGEVVLDRSLFVFVPVAAFGILGFLLSIYIAIQASDDMVQALGDNALLQASPSAIPDDGSCRGLCSNQQQDLEGLRSYLQRIF
jgi:hypothetical protein